MSRKDSKGRVLYKGETQRDSGVYRFEYRENGKRKYYESWRLVTSDKTPVGKMDKPALRDEKVRIQKKMLSGLSIDGGKVTLNEYFDAYCATRKHDGKPLKDTTLYNYRAMWNGHVRDAIGIKALDSVTSFDIKSFYNELGLEVSYGTVGFINKLIKSLYNKAITERLVDYNPTYRALHEIENNEEKRQSLTVEQQREFLQYLRRNNAEMYVKVIVLLDARIRISELAGLTWSRVDFSNNTITIDRQVKRIYREGAKGSSIEFTTTKSGRTIVIAMTKDMRNELLAMYAVYNNSKSRRNVCVGQESDFVFLSKKGRLMDAGNFNKELLRELDTYNQTARNKIEKLTAHCFKHTAVKNLCNTKLPMAIVSKASAHANEETTKKHYMNLTSDDTKRIAEELDKYNAKIRE